MPPPPAVDGIVCITYPTVVLPQVPGWLWALLLVWLSCPSKPLQMGSAEPGMGLSLSHHAQHCSRGGQGAGTP